MADFGIKDIGSAVGISINPSGNVFNSITAPLSVTQGVANVITGLSPPGLVNNLTSLKNSITGTPIPGNVLSNPNQTLPFGGRNVKGFRNVLEKFASYSPLWTMCCLESKQFNNPASYRGNPASLKHVVFSSAGRYDSQRTKTAYGTPEYFVNNFTMNTVISAGTKNGNSNAITFAFDIYEPYSMGLFLQSLQNAALNAGYASYLDNCPYLLKLDFVGYTDNGQPLQVVKSKYFTCKLKKVTFDVTESGSNYKVEAFPFNHQAFSNVINNTPKDLAITGNTVQELLVSGESSLCAALAKVQKDMVTEEGAARSKEDVYIVVFPETSSDNVGVNTASGATTNKATTPTDGSGTQTAVANKPSIPTEFGSNSIANASMGFDASSGGNYVFKKESDVYDEKTGRVNRDQMTIDPKNRSFTFAQKQSITNIITQIILSSDYAANALKKENIAADGTIKWFKLDIQVQLLEYDPLRKDYAKKIIYRVIPYKVHSSIFQNPTAAPIGYAQLEKKICKEYQYIYSGQNQDLLKFDIQINNMFYTPTTASPPKKSQDNVNKDLQATNNTAETDTKTVVGPAPEVATAKLGSPKAAPDPNPVGVTPGGAGQKDNQTRTAEAFQNAFLKGTADLINATVEILGDPYYMVDSGIGNYFSAPSKEYPESADADGSMTYEGGDVYIYITFRTPSDVLEAAGLMGFPNGGAVSPFSGIYKVLSVENKFNDGAFRQTLKVIRMMGQPMDFDKPLKTDKGSVLAIQSEGKVENKAVEAVAKATNVTNAPPLSTEEQKVVLANAEKLQSETQAALEAFKANKTEANWLKYQEAKDAANVVYDKVEQIRG